MERRYARRLTGKLVSLTCADGASHRGRLIGVSGHSLWLVASGEDVFIDVSDVVVLAAASARPPARTPDLAGSGALLHASRPGPQDAGADLRSAGDGHGAGSEPGAAGPATDG